MAFTYSPSHFPTAALLLLSPLVLLLPFSQPWGRRAEMESNQYRISRTKQTYSRFQNKGRIILVSHVCLHVTGKGQNECVWLHDFPYLSEAKRLYIKYNLPIRCVWFTHNLSIASFLTIYIIQLKTKPRGQIVVIVIPGVHSAHSFSWTNTEHRWSQPHMSY